MEKNLKEAFEQRRTCYALKPESSIPDQELEQLLHFAVWNLPSAFNSQSARLVLLLGKHHTVFWEIVKATLKKRISAEAFVKTEEKIDTCFASGYGTVLFFEEMRTVEELQQSFPTYAEKFPAFSEHSSAIHQFAVWTLLESVGLG
ncbi:MAG: nitroreductase family protein [Planctomycetaceae bacterium]|jgi:predicted oxidoreductase (fatty acid repression mutant protein)|nr:nitroreductase family protein [Planctomycetaceae bacterium]